MKLFRKEIIRRADGTPYLIRWFIVYRSWFGQLMLHKILLTDNDCMHDHPWNFVSIILKGGYVEHSTEFIHDSQGYMRPRRYGQHSRLYGPGSILYRRANWAHRLEVFQTCWTLVWTGRKIRRWGFWTPRGFEDHHNYTSTGSCE